MTPFPSLSTYAINFLISYFLGSNPKALIATLSSLASMYPDINVKAYQQIQCRKDRKPL